MNFRLTFALVIGFVVATASCALAFDPSRFTGEVSLDLGNRTDQFDWNIAGNLNGGDPNILSELTWRDLEVQQLTLRGNGRVSAQGPIPGGHVAGRFAVGFGAIRSGRCQDSDYDGDNRTLEFSRSNNRSDEGETLDLTLGAGESFRIWQGRAELTPLIGFAYHRQGLTMTDGYQTISLSPGDLGPFPGLNSSYEATWRGGWVGLDGRALLGSAVSIQGGIEFHRANYYAEADWNLRDDFAHPVSFSHSAVATGVVGRCGVEYPFTPHWVMALTAEWVSFQAKDGIDRAYNNDGSQGVTRLNRAHWRSEAYSSTILYRF